MKRVAPSHLDGAATLDGAVRQHLGDDGVRHDRALSDEVRLSDEPF